jgi:hypothetical protein
MSSLPNVKVDANGFPIVAGVQERTMTQDQADYTDIKKSLEQAQGINGFNARRAFADNPGASPGLITSLVGSGATADNGIVKVLAQIDAQTKAKRALDAQTASAKISTDKFNNTLVGKAWSVLKYASRGIAVGGQAIVEGINAAVRQTPTTFQSIKTGLEGVAESKDAWINPTVQTETSQKLQNDIAKLPKNPAKDMVDQTVLGQVLQNLAKGQKVDLGNGFFPSEETGAGFAARQAQLKNLKQAYVVDGKTYYRPYSFMDPITSVLTLGHPEWSAARVINALGEIGLSVYLDPGLAYAQLRNAQRSAKLLQETSSGIKAAKAATSVSTLSAQLEEAHRGIEASFEAMKIAKAEGAMGLEAESKVYREAWAKFNQTTDEFNNVNINYDDIATFLSGAGGKHVIDALVNATDFMQIQKLAKGKFTVDEAIKLASATSREEVLSAIAPYIANGTVAPRVLETGTRTGRALRGASDSLGNSAIGRTVSDAFGSVISKGDIVAGTQVIKGSVARAATRSDFSQKVVGIAHAADASRPGQALRNLGRKYNAFLPERGGVFVHTENKDKLIEAVNNVGRYMNLPKAKLDDLIRSIAYSPTTSESGFQATAKLFDAIFEHNAGKFTGEQLDEFRKVTRVFETNRNEMSKYWAQQHATGADINFGMVDGKKITLHSSHLDSELLHSFVYIPDPKEVADFLKKAQLLGKSRVNFTEGMSSLNNLWKKSVMVRPAYIARNIIEEQIRTFGVGHISFFNRPLAALGLWLGRDGSSGFKSFLNRYDEVKNDVHGNSFKMGSSAEEFAAEQLAGDLINPYVSFMSDSSVGSSGDAVINKLVKSLGYTSEVYGHPLWWQGYASQMRVLHNSEFVRRVIATKPGEELATVKYFLKGEGRKTLDKFIGLKDDAFKEFAQTEDGLMKYLFTGTNEMGQQTSVLARIEEMAGRGSMAPLIKQLLLKGSIKVGDATVIIPNGKTIAEHNLKLSENVTKGIKMSKVKKDINKEFSKVLEDTFAQGGDWTNVQMTLPTRTSEVMKGKVESFGDIGNKIAKSFFDKAVEFEKTTTMGPEWRQAYWDKVAEISHALDIDAVTALEKQAPQSLGTLRDAISKKLIGTNHKAWGNLAKADGSGPLTLDDAHQFATNAANKRVEELYYNAQKRNLLFHQLRLIVPFAQAWEDTMKAWGKIALNNPDQVYKVSKVLDWASSSGSSAMYELTDAQSYYDPNQGLFFKDPQTGERKFFVPFASTALNVLQGLVPGASDMRLTGPFEFSAQPQSFNFALGGGSIIPGMGFGVTWSLAALSSMNKSPLKILPPQLEEEMYKLFFPYGTPDVKHAGLFEGPLFTANWARIAGATFGIESSYASAFAPSMGYLASSGEYDLNSQDDQIRLTRDGDNMARYFTFWRGITGALTPIPFAMRPEALARNKDGYTVLASSVWADFKNLEVAAGGNKAKAYADFLDLYGPEQIFAITKATTGYEPTNLATYALIKENPDVLVKYKDTYGYFYPNGELSKVLYEFQQQRGALGRMSAQQIMEKATNIRYAAAKDRMETRAIGEGWSSSQHASALKSLKEAYTSRGMIVAKQDTQWKDRVIAQLRAAANDDTLADSDALAGVRAYLVQRDKALAAAGTVTLKSAASAPQREWLAGEAKTLIEKYPEFQKIFYGIFKRELEGK